MEQINLSKLKLALTSYRGLVYQGTANDTAQLPGSVSIRVGLNSKESSDNSFSETFSHAARHNMTLLCLNQLTELWHTHREFFRISLGPDPFAKFRTSQVAPKKPTPIPLTAAVLWPGSKKFLVHYHPRAKIGCSSVQEPNSVLCESRACSCKGRKHQTAFHGWHLWSKCTNCVYTVLQSTSSVLVSLRSK